VTKGARRGFTARTGDRTDAVAPQTGTAILVLAAFVLPGFVTVLLRERTYRVRAGSDPFELLLTALAYSAVIYLAAAVYAVVAGITSPQVAALAHGHSTLATYTGLAVAGLVVGPCVVTMAGKAWSGSDARRHWLVRLRLDPSHRTRSAWEYWSSQRRPCLVRVTLEDGRVVGGLLGRRSLAGRDLDQRDTYLEERWLLDDADWFTGETAAGTLGLYVSASAIVSLELYDHRQGARRDV
jgi:Family of unknown function (DUF6338)